MQPSPPTLFTDDALPRPLVVSHGLGVNSVAMLVGLRRRGIVPDIILHADTGGERRLTRAYLPIAQAWLRRIGFPEIVEVRYRPRHGIYRDIIADALVKMTLPSLAFGRKACSVKWKVSPQWSYLKKHPVTRTAWSSGQKIRHAIGYDAGPADMRRGADAADTDLEEFVYFLRDWGWDRERCITEIRADAELAEVAASLGADPCPPKSSCGFCPALKPIELDDIVANEPDMADLICAVEDAAFPNLQRIDGLWRKATANRPGSMTAYLRAQGIDTAAAARRGSHSLTLPANDIGLPPAPINGARYAIRHQSGFSFVQTFGEAAKILSGADEDELCLWLVGEWRRWPAAGDALLDAAA